MISASLHLWGNGAVTLPKKWRDQFPTKNFMAVETPEGLLIRPIVDIEYYEEKDGACGLRFPMGIEAGELLKLIQKANKELDKERPVKKSVRKLRG